MPGTSKSGGARKGAGRKSGDAWASKRPPAQRTLARVSRSKILEERDPLAELVRLGFEANEEGERIKALSAALPYIYPRLSMAVVADATPKDNKPVDFERLQDELLARMNRCWPAPNAIDVEMAEETSETDCQTAAEDESHS